MVFSKLCGYNCGRPWDEEGGENGFEDCVSAFHKKKSQTPNYNDILRKFQKWLIHQRCCVVSYKSGLQVCDSNCWNVFEGMFSQALTLATERAVRVERERIIGKIKLWRPVFYIEKGEITKDDVSELLSQLTKDI